MDFIQTASAAYVLLIFVIGFGAVVRAAATGRKMATTNITGWPAFILAVAVLICAVTTLVHVS